MKTRNLKIRAAMKIIRMAAVMYGIYMLLEYVWIHRHEFRRVHHAR